MGVSFGLTCNAGGNQGQPHFLTSHVHGSRPRIGPARCGVRSSLGAVDVPFPGTSASGPKPHTSGAWGDGMRVQGRGGDCSPQGDSVVGGAVMIR